ncbi:MAG: hypothetical protein R2774_00290 [Saprospiraceae bacterium]
MKARFTLFIMVSMLLSCTSLQKMMDNGDYDRAFTYSASKLKGKKYKQTEYVRAFENAFEKLQGTSLHNIEVWNRNITIQNANNILREYQLMQKRQDVVLPLLPLISREGYEAQFAIHSYDGDIMSMENQLCKLYYDEANYLWTSGIKDNDKRLIKNAYFTFEKISGINANFKDVRQLMKECREQAVTNVEVEIKNNLPYKYGDWISQDMKNISLRSLNNSWYQYQIKDSHSHLTSADFVMVVDINSLDFSPEREFVRELVETKSIPEKEKTHSKKESSKTDKVFFNEVKVKFIETIREKNAHLSGTLRVYDPRKHVVLETYPINIEHHFNGYASAINGDERALSDTNRKKLDHFLEPFPMESEMVSALSRNFGDIIIGKVKSAQL